MKLVFDTHSYIWLLSDNPRLSTAARESIGSEDAELFLPTLALAELHYTHRRGRHTVSLQQAVSHAQRTANIEILPFDFLAASLLPDGLDIHDAIIVATALTLQRRTGETVSLLTADEMITASGIVPVIW